MAGKPTATLVTGGSNGIGAAIAKARAEAGEAVINLDRDSPPSAIGSHSSFVAISLLHLNRW